MLQRGVRASTSMLRWAISCAGHPAGNTPGVGPRRTAVARFTVWRGDAAGVAGLARMIASGQAADHVPAGT